MKKLICLLNLLLLVASSNLAQKVGINNTDPNLALDVKGGFATRAIKLTPFENGVNIPDNISFVEVGPGTAAVTCFAPTFIDGRRLVILNKGGYDNSFYGMVIPPNQSREFICRNPGGWTLLSGATGNESWSLKGNAGTDTSVNFIGTTDNMPLRFKVNNSHAGIISAGSGNVGIGYSTLGTGLSGSYNSALGNASLGRNKGNNNVAVGYFALESDTLSFENSAIGSNSMKYRESGDENTAVGFNSMAQNNGLKNVALGSSSLYNDLNGDNNISIGYSSMYKSKNSKGVIAIGTEALISDTAADGVVAIGRAALYNNNSISTNLAVGDSALFNNSIGAILPLGHASNNIAIGPKSLFSNTTGSSNIAIGYNCLIKNTTGKQNIGFGRNALSTNIDGNWNTAIGEDALRKLTFGGGNFAIGSYSLSNFTTGLSNVGLGLFALGSLTTGDFNTAIGTRGLANITTGENNISLGYQSLQYLYSGNGNIGIGEGSSLVQKGNYNTIISTTGPLSGIAFSGVDSSSENVIVGTTNRSLFSNSSRNVFVGNNIADKQLVSANTNVAVGDSASFNLRNGSANVAVGAFAGGNNNNGNNNVFIGYKSGFSAIGSNKLYIENSATDNENALIYGDFEADSLLLNAKTVIRNNEIVKGFTKLGGYGTDVPSIKMKKIVSTNGASGATTSFLHGLTQSKILSVSVLINASSGNDILARSTFSGYEYDCYVSSTAIVVKNISSNDGNIINRPIRILITYEE